MSLPWYLRTEIDPVSVYFDFPANALDLETTNIEKGSALVPENRVVLAAHGGYSHPVMVREDPRDFYAKQSQEILVAHNAKFELSWLNRLGVDTSGLLVWDTMLAEYVLAGNRRVPLDLGSVCRRYGLPGKEPVVDALMGGQVCPSEMPRHLLEARVLRDTETSLVLFERQRDRLRAEGLLGCMYTRCVLTPVLAEIEATGIKVDQALTKAETRKVLAELRAVEAEITKLTGGVNPRSVPQMAHYIYGTLGFAELLDRRGNPRRNAPSKQFPAGVPKVDADTLDKLKAETKEQREFLKLREKFGEYNARYTKTLQFLDAVARDYDGIMYGRFNQAVTQTHRLSSSGRKIPIVNTETGEIEEKGIQFQNFPRDYKKLFTVRDPNYLFVDIDGSQLEFRVAVFLGQDRQGARDIVTGHDVHRYTASVLHDIEPAEVTKKQRTDAKPFTFGPLFGKVSGTRREVEYYEAFRKRYEEVENTQKRWIAEVLKSKVLKTATGLKFYWPGCRMKSDGYVEHSTNIKNYPIQSLATAEIIPASTVILYWLTKSADLRCRFVNSVHDSLCLECHSEDVDKLKELAEFAFLQGTYDYLARVYGIEFNIPLGCEICVGTHWGAGEETTYSYPNPYVLPLVAAGAK